MVIQREAARAILLTPSQEVLLLRVRPPGDRDCFWITPGGGLEAGESPQTGLRRELAEELGVQAFDIGPAVWRRQHTFTWGEQRICQREQFHIVRIARFEPYMADAEEAQYLEQFRWWAVPDLQDCPERIAPPTLAQIVMDYLAHGPPADLPWWVSSTDS